MAIFDELRHLTTYLYDAHLQQRHHLSDLYELVQYAGNIVPRLYLMITVGSVYLRVSKETDPQQAAGFPGSLPDVEMTKSVDELPPIKELMNDMLEMARGVQHPTRGLFLRYYMSGMTRDFLPDGTAEGCDCLPNHLNFLSSARHHGSIHDSIHFIRQNFIEMNKLWVRLQHQGHSRDREKREQERRELRLLVGSNLVRLSQLEALDIDSYKSSILPSILEEIVSCRDVIAQEYLMEVIIQVFQDEFHLQTLSPFLSSTAQLERTVNVKQIVISLIDRFANYAARMREEAGENEPGIPNEIRLFDIFWNQIIELVRARPEFSLDDIISLLSSLTNLSLNCYPENIEYVDSIMGFAKDRILEGRKVETWKDSEEEARNSLLQLLLSPVHTYNVNLLIFLRFPSSKTQNNGASVSLGGHYSDLLFLQPYSTRRQVGHTIAKTALKSALTYDFVIDSKDSVDLFFGELCNVLIRDQLDGGLFGPKPKERVDSDNNLPNSLPLDWEDIQEEQNMVARLVHLVKTPSADPSLDVQLLAVARMHFGHGGQIRIRFTLPAIVTASIRIANLYVLQFDPKVPTKTPHVYLLKFIHETIISLSEARDYAVEEALAGCLLDGGSSKTSQHGLMPSPDMALRLFLLAAQAADDMNQEELAYEFIVQALTVYEESISDSKAQFTAITLVMGNLLKMTVFGYENFETLITKCAGHCSRLLKRADQSRGLLLAAHIFWGDDSLSREDGKPMYRDPKKSFECLQRALKIADSVLDKSVTVELLVEILEKFLWFYENRHDQITPSTLNHLIKLIHGNLKGMEIAELPVGRSPQPGASLFADKSSASRISSSIVKHFRNTLGYITLRKMEEQSKLEAGVTGIHGGFGGTVKGRWGEVEVK